MIKSLYISLYFYIKFYKTHLMSVPVMIKFVNDKEVDRITGLVPVSKIKEFCEVE